MMLFIWGFLIGHRGRVACAGETPHFITMLPRTVSLEVTELKAWKVYDIMKK